MIHSNMTPFTARKDLYENFTNQSQKYEKLSGNDNLWKNKKEIEPLFEPMRDLTNPFGMPVMTTELQGRYTPSNKNNYGNYDLIFTKPKGENDWSGANLFITYDQTMGYYIDEYKGIKLTDADSEEKVIEMLSYNK